MGVKLSLIVENQMNEQFKREIQILYSLRHIRIVKLHFDFTDGKSMYLGMEFASGGSLFEKLRKAGKLGTEQACRYFLEICEALDYLHHLSQKVIHRDIKPENILLDSDDHVKLGDFGWANHYNGQKRDTFCGTLEYLSPEMIMGTGHDESVDMWCMGVLLYEMTTGKSPFGSNSKETTCRMILAVDIRFPKDLDNDACDLIKILCKRKPAERLTVSAAMSHRFVLKVHEGVRGLPHDEEADPDLDFSRPSVVVQKLRTERKRLNAEMEQVLLAKKSTDDKQMEVMLEFNQTCEKIKEEQTKRKQITAACAEVAKENEAREYQLEIQRSRLQTLKAEQAKIVKGGPRWFSGRRSSNTAMAGA